MHNRNSAGVCQMDRWSEKGLNATEKLPPQASGTLLHYNLSILIGTTTGTFLSHCVLCLA